MSQRYAVDKGSRGMEFHFQTDDSNKFRKLCADSAPPRRKQINSWRSKNESEKFDSYYLNFPKHIDNSSIKSENVDFRKVTEKNVFIDSYYPKLLGDFSEDYSGKSWSSHEKIHKLWTADSTESDSRRTYATLRDIYGYTNPEFAPVVFEDSKSRCSDQATLQKSSRSRLTLNCNTYTLISLSSDLESFGSRNNLNTCVGVTESNSCCINERRDDAEGEGETEGWTKEEKIKNLGSSEGSRDTSASECFTHLYKRIETLEELLQQTLEIAVQPKEYKRVEKPERQKPQSIKNKLTLPKSSELKNHSSIPKVREAATTCDAVEEKENSDTENELISIKKRLSALERRVREEKNTITLSSEVTSETPITSNNSALNETDLRSGEPSGTFDSAEPKEEHLLGQLLSQTTFVIPRKLFILSTEPEAQPEKISTNGTTDRVKRKRMTKCKRINRKTSSVFNPRRKTFCTKKPSLKITNEKSSKTPHVQFILNEKSSQSIVSSSCFVLKKYSSNTFTDSDIKQEEEKEIMTRSQIFEKRAKKRKKKGNVLCKKTSIMNMILSQGEQTRQNLCELTNASTRRFNFDRNPSAPSAPKLENNFWSPCSCLMTLSARYPYKPRLNSFFRKTIQYNCEVEKDTPSDKQSMADPIEILKGGGKIRIPVLFEEVCKRPSSKTPGRNMSNISMRFVLVQEDPKHPLRKLIKKLPRKTTEKTEQYMFGVSKCSCNNQTGSHYGSKLWKEASGVQKAYIVFDDF